LTIDNAGGGVILRCILNDVTSRIPELMQGIHMTEEQMKIWYTELSQKYIKRKVKPNRIRDWMEGRPVEPIRFRDVFEGYEIMLPLLSVMLAFYYFAFFSTIEYAPWIFGTLGFIVSTVLLMCIFDFIKRKDEIRLYKQTLEKLTEMYGESSIAKGLPVEMVVYGDHSDYPWQGAVMVPGDGEVFLMSTEGVLTIPASGQVSVKKLTECYYMSRDAKMVQLDFQDTSIILRILGWSPPPYPHNDVELEKCILDVLQKSGFEDVMQCDASSHQSLLYRF